MREIVVQPSAPVEDDRPAVEVKFEDQVLIARRPKDAIMARSAGIFNDRYAPDSVVARAAFDFMEATLDRDSWAYVVNRLNDRDDAFDTEHLIAIFEGVFAELVAADPAVEPANRAERRSSSKAKAGSRR